jgi:hypothetical protein
MHLRKGIRQGRQKNIPCSLIVVVNLQLLKTSDNVKESQRRVIQIHEREDGGALQSACIHDRT